MKLFGVLLGQLEQLEDRGREDTWVAGFVRYLMRPASSFVREVLVMLHELDFHKVCKEVQDILDQFALSFVSTNIDESCFQRCSQREQASSTEPLSRYHVGKYSELLKDHDRLAIPITATSQSASTNVAPSTDVYEYQNLHKCSLDKALTVEMGPASCHSPAPQALKMVGVAWTSSDCVDGDIARVKRAWLSLLCPAQHLMIDKDAKNGPGGLVLGATPHGVIICNMERPACGHPKHCLSRARRGKGLTDSPWYLKPIVRHESILVQREALSRSPSGLLFSVDEGKPEPLLKVAALSGFNQMKVFLLTKPMKDLGCGSGFKKQHTEKQTLDRLF